MKEYGGYLQLELPMKNEYFADISEKDIVRLDCGRSTFWYALNIIKPKKIYVPYFNCINSTDPIESVGIEYEFYRLDEDLLPINISPKKDEALLWINYYGNASKKHFDYIKSMTKKTNVLVDHCQGFFTKPIMGVYNCYSPRKFFGISDGAYLIKENIEKIELEQMYSSEHANYLLECIEYGTNSCYEKSLKNESRLGNKPMLMSKFTKRMLQSIEYDIIKNKRRENMLRLHDELKDINCFSINVESDTHMCYPCLIYNDGLIDKLIENKIYVPTLWRHVKNYFKDKDVLEVRLSEHMLNLPIDQRYNKEDMHEIAKIVKKLCNFGVNKYDKR